jgi:carboxypeptidase T
MRRLAFALATACAALSPAPALADFPAPDAGYHNDAEMRAQVDATVAAYPAIATRLVLGPSHEGRELWAVKLSDNVAVDEPEPEVLITAGQHAREHITVEMALYLIGELTSRYATDARIRGIVDGREIWIVPNVNPDGSEYDIAGDTYHYWRKNRQPNAGTDAVGTDLNRNWGFRWGCCGGSSDDPLRESYRGPAPFSAPETQRLRDFVLSRVVGGVQQIRAALDLHAFAELILWPFGHTRADTGPRMTRDDRDALATLATGMARTNGYTAEQSSDLYITDGAFDDWLWGANHVFAFTMEMYPRNGAPDFYPPDEVLGRETRRNREAVLLLLENAACVYAVIGRQGRYCGSAPLFAGDEPPPIALTGAANFGLSFRYRSAVRIRVRGVTVFRSRAGHGWRRATLSLSRFAGRTVRLRIDGDVAGLRVTRF